MRKYLWLGTLLVVASALGVWATAHYAARHPSSFIGHFFSAARISMSLPVHSNPQAGDQVINPATPSPLAQESRGCKDVEPSVAPSPVPATKATVPVQPTDPEEIIQIENIDPKIAKAIAEVLEVSQVLKQVGQPEKRLVGQGVPEVLMTIIEGDLVQLVAPDRPGRAVGGEGDACQQPLRMPYCDEPLEECWRQAKLCWRLGDVRCVRPQANTKAQTTEGNNVDEFMPYVEEKNSGSLESEASEDEQSAMEEEEDVPAPDEVIPMHRDPYHYHHGGCPYHGGHYCPAHFSRPYYPMPMRQPEAQPETQPEIEVQQEPPAPMPMQRTWFGIDVVPGGDVDGSGDMFPIHWDREDTLAATADKVG